MAKENRIDTQIEFGLLADPLRRAIINKLLAGPKHVTAITEGLSVTQSAVSQQLAKLKEAEMIRQERHGKFVIYSVAPAAMKRLLEQLDAWREYIALLATSSSAGLEGLRESPDTDIVDDKMDIWAKQWEQHDPLTVGILVRLRLISRLLRKTMAKVTSRFDLNSSELHLFGLLDRIGPPHESTLSELSKMALVSMPAISRHLNRIEAKGLILRLPNTGDGRSNLIRLTDKGRELLHRVMDYQRVTYFYPLYQMPYEKRVSIAGMTRELLKKLPV